MLKNLLIATGRRGKWVLPLGLLLAIAMPFAAQPMRHAIAPLMMCLLVVSFLQLDSSLSELARNVRQSLVLVLLMQLLVPILLLLIMQLLHIAAQWQIPILLVACASSITGGPSIVMMLGGNGQASIRLLLVSIVLLPLTVFIVFALTPLFSTSSVVWKTPLILFCMIAGAYLLATLMRRFLLGPQTAEQRAVQDGVAALLLALVVVGLMSAIHTVWDQPLALLSMLCFATLVNVGMQIIGLLINRGMQARLPVTMGVMSGNRAIALFLAALPASLTDAFLLFVACYQIPMYLTPLIGNFYYRTTADG